MNHQAEPPSSPLPDRPVPRTRDSATLLLALSGSILLFPGLCALIASLDFLPMRSRELLPAFALVLTLGASVTGLAIVLVWLAIRRAQQQMRSNADIPGSRPRSRPLSALMLIVGTTLLLPGLWAIFVAFIALREKSWHSNLWLASLIGFAVALGGIFLVQAAVRGPRRG